MCNKGMKPKDLIPGSIKERKAETKEFAIRLGKHLRKFRESKDISQEGLSNMAGYYHTFVGKIENGRYSPSLYTIWRLTHYLGISLSDFFKHFK